MVVPGWFTVVMWLFWLVFATVTVSYALKARLEDEFLSENLPGYPDYRARVRHRLLPGIW